MGKTFQRGSFVWAVLNGEERQGRIWHHVDAAFESPFWLVMFCHNGFTHPIHERQIRLISEPTYSLEELLAPTPGTQP